MKLLTLGCKTFRDGITTAIVFFITGLFIILSGTWVMPEIWYLPHIIIGMGLFVSLMAPVIVVATYLKNKS